MSVIKFLPQNVPMPEQSEVLRYMGVKKDCPADILTLAADACAEIYSAADFRVCYRLCPVEHKESSTSLGFLTTGSLSLKKLLEECENAVVFAATIGAGADRIIAKYSKIRPSAALAADAAASALIECLCDSFCEHLKALEFSRGKFLTQRFSPGYGGLALETQKDFFEYLNCPKNIGLCLTDSMLMTPTKSVTAIVGISSRESRGCTHKCQACQNRTCIYRNGETK